MRTLVAVLALALAGCKGVPASKACYIATAATVQSVDVGMKVAGDLYRAGKLNDEQRHRIETIHDVYRPLAKAAVAGCKALQPEDAAGVERVSKQIQTAAEPVLKELTAVGVE